LPPTVNGNTVTEVNGNEELRLTNLLGNSTSLNIVDESAFTGSHGDASYYQYRVEDSTSGTAQSYMLHMLQASDVNAAAVTAQVQNDGTDWTITLTSPTGTAVIVLNQGMTSTGGTIGFSASGTPTNTTSLTSFVEPIGVTTNGPAWQPLAVTGVSPNSGPSSGGTVVTITGSGFTGATQVMFDSAMAASFTVVSDTQIIATAPAHIVGGWDVTVTTPVGTSSTNTADVYTYVAGLLAGNSAAVDTSTLPATTDNYGFGLTGSNLELYVDNSNGNLSSDELARIDDAVAAIDSVTAAYGVTITEVSDPTQANMMLRMDTSTALGGSADGVLGCMSDMVTIVSGWDWYAGADPTQIGAGQYDFQTVVIHELGHALGVGHNNDPLSVMYPELDAGMVKRALTAADTSIADMDAGPGALHAGVAEPATGRGSGTGGQPVHRADMALGAVPFMVALIGEPVQQPPLLAEASDITGFGVDQPTRLPTFADLVQHSGTAVIPPLDPESLPQEDWDLLDQFFRDEFVALGDSNVRPDNDRVQDVVNDLTTVATDLPASSLTAALDQPAPDDSPDLTAELF
jgi:hypothetical protein